jgi:hypothetical protein
MCMLGRSLFVLLYFFFWSLCCLFFFDIRVLRTLLRKRLSLFLFIELFVSQASEWSCICVLRYQIRFFLPFCSLILELFRQCGIFCISFYLICLSIKPSCRLQVRYFHVSFWNIFFPKRIKVRTSTFITYNVTPLATLFNVKLVCRWRKRYVLYK